ncbi:MAG TPA: hypothetical protein PLO14_12650 [Accumulibacter sp.]|uniref:hypothetical protein n=1 Tax=Accumulibacter sp. TaxID=2053492 RepID=UPI0025DA25BF|nr:hypothetical protein [Accumulibacter sp.]MCM8599995.1 hypothetical protein [Accumulibacter sp.]MCM8664182.1 hypothetical protein [Accumulibacter sp.]HNC53066.1 hypothetical protein [Accumulibacter sp.]
MARFLVVALGSCLLAGCASVDPYGLPPVMQRLQRSDEVGVCTRLFQNSDLLIDAAGTRDVQAHRVPGFPHLRVDRVLAELVAESGAQNARQILVWREALAALDEAGRRVELLNAGPDAAVSIELLGKCRQLLAAADQADLPALVDAAKVPDDYSSSMRLLGLYPLTRYAFAAGIRNWQTNTLAVFAAHAASDPPGPPRVHYGVAEQSADVPLFGDLSLPAMPTIARDTLARLIVRHAPRFAIATSTNDDLPGALVWQRDAGTRWQVGVAADQPALYVRSGQTRFGGRWRLQLIYTLWFPARPSAHAYDVLAGRLDGLLWRVTVAENGTPLLYDTIHPCGCYHLFIPTEHVRARPQADGIDEGLFVPQTLPAPAVDERVVLKLAPGTHYLQRVEIAAAAGDAGLSLALRDDEELRMLPLPGGGTHSAFAPDGLVAGSERLERFYFWPTGIASAGQMRQWGRHATAFVGRRHFDDPLLIDRYFEELP